VRGDPVRAARRVTAAVVKPTASWLCMPLTTRALRSQRRPRSVLSPEEAVGGESARNQGGGLRRWTSLDGLASCLSGVTLQEGELTAIFVLNNATR
jgi:hypothetical protein